MPHCVIENFNAFADQDERDAALQLCLSVCAGSGIMAREDIKVRSMAPEAALFGDGRTSFVHVTVSMLAGRSDGQKTALAEALRAQLRDRFPKVASISIDVRDMNSACYRKSLA